MSVCSKFIRVYVIMCTNNNSNRLGADKVIAKITVQFLPHSVN